MSIYEVKTFTDLSKRDVLVFQPTSPEEKPQFKGRAQVQFGPQQTPTTVVFPFEKQETLE